MEHVKQFEHSDNSTLVAVNCWANNDHKPRGELQAGVRYQKTRSTLSLGAGELLNLPDAQSISSFKSLIRLCKCLDREEILIEFLDALPGGDDAQEIRNCLDKIQHNITATSREMKLSPARVALEKRGKHFDVRIYPRFQ